MSERRITMKIDSINVHSTEVQALGEPIPRVVYEQGADISGEFITNDMRFQCEVPLTADEMTELRDFLLRIQRRALESFGQFA